MALVAFGLVVAALGYGYWLLQGRSKTVAAPASPVGTAPAPAPARSPAPVRQDDLGAALACEKSGDWSCVARRAQAVLDTDSGNETAKALLRRATLVQLGIDPASPAATQPAPPPAGAQAGTGSGAQPITPADCESRVRAGRLALQMKSYDQALANANDAMAALALCPGAEQLKQDALRAKQGHGR